MKQLPLAIAVAAAFTLSACGKGPIGFSGDSTSSNESGGKTDISYTKDMVAGKSEKLTNSIGCSQLIATALRPLAELEAIDEAEFSLKVKYDDMDLLPVSASLADLEFSERVPAAITDKHVQLAKIEKARLTKHLGESASLDYAIAQKAVCLDKVEAKNIAGHSCLVDYYVHVLAGVAVLALSEPLAMPAFKTVYVDPVSKYRSFPVGLLQSWAQGAVGLIDMSYSLQPTWITGLNGSLISRADGANTYLRIMKQVFATPTATIRRLAVRPAITDVKLKPGELTAPLEVLLPDRDMAIMENDRGLGVVLNGNNWYGDSQLFGAKCEVALETSSSLNIGRKTTDVDDSSTKQSTSNKVSVDVK